MKKTILKLSVLLMASALMFGFAGGKLTLKEKIDKYQKIPVFILPGKIGIKSSGVQMNKCPENKETIETPKEYEEVLPLIINALNKGFGTSAFTAAKYDEIPTKKGTFLGAEVDVQDWASYEHKFIVYCDLSVNYDQEMSGISGSITIKGNLTCFVNLRFWDVIDDKIKIFGNVIGYNVASAKSTKYPIEHCFKMSEFTAKEASNSLAEPLKQSVESRVAKFTEKQMKKYEKAMKKKKK